MPCANLARSGHLKIDGLAGVKPYRWCDRYVASLEITEVALVGVPFDDVARVKECREFGDALSPGDEALTVFLIVPRRSDEARPVAGPVNTGVAPDRALAVDSAIGQGCMQRPIVHLPVRQVPKGWKADSHDRSVTHPRPVWKKCCRSGGPRFA